LNIALIIFVAGAWLAPQEEKIGEGWAVLSVALLVLFAVSGVILWYIGGMVHSYLIGREVLDKAAESTPE
jgi:hypothetical protein